MNSCQERWWHYAEPPKNNAYEHTGGSVSLKFNSTIIKRQENVGNETGTGKFMLNFPANYTGEVTARVLGR